MVFAGRKRELAELRGALSGGSRLILVAGDAGVGKTRLVAEYLRLEVADGPLSVWGTCLPLAEQLPFLPVATALDVLSRIDDGGWPPGTLASVPPYALEETARLLPHLQPAGPGPAIRSAGWQRQRMFAGITELLAAAARPSGLILVIDDAQWADSATLDFLTFLTRGDRPEHVTVVATVRSDETPLEEVVSRWLSYARSSELAHEIRLMPLTRDEMAEQTAGLTSGQPSAVNPDELFARGEGNPFFTEQLVADALAGQHAAACDQSAGLPARLNELLTARVRDCSAEAWSALAALSIARRSLTEDQLHEATGLGTGPLRLALRELTGRALAETTADGGHRTRHALLAEAVAAALLPGERQAIHERVAGLLQASGTTLAAEAADHWAAAGRRPEERHARLTAGAAAEQVFGYAEAAAHWQRSIELSQAADAAELSQADAAALPALYLRAIDALHRAGDVDRAGELAEEAYRRFAGHRDPAIAAVVRERVARFRGIGDLFLGGHGKAGSGVPLIIEALELFEQAPPSAEHAEALIYRAHLPEDAAAARISPVPRGPGRGGLRYLAAGPRTG